MRAVTSTTMQGWPSLLQVRMLFHGSKVSRAVEFTPPLPKAAAPSPSSLLADICRPRLSALWDASPPAPPDPAAHSQYPLESQVGHAMGAYHIKMGVPMARREPLRSQRRHGHFPKYQSSYVALVEAT